MFAAIKEKAKKVMALNQDKMMTDILKNELLQAQIIDLNRKQLYEQGLQADGTPTGEYSKNTIEGTSKYLGKIQKQQRYDHVTLKDTGAFYASMEVKVLPAGMVIEADDPNGLQVMEPKMLGLTKESLSEIIPEIKQTLIEKVRTQIA